MKKVSKNALKTLHLSLLSLMIATPAMANTNSVINQGDLTVAKTANTTYYAGAGTTVRVTETDNLTNATVSYGVNVDGNTLILQNGAVKVNPNVIASKADLAGLRTGTQATTQALNDLNNKVDAVNATAGQATTTANDAITTANNARTTANGAIATANQARTTAESAIATANNARTTAESAIATANNARTTANGAIATANGAIATANNARNTSNEALATATQAKTTATQAHTVATGALATANGTLSQAQDHQATLNRHASQIAENTAGVNSNKQAIDDLTNKAVLAVADYNATKAKVQQNSQAVANAQGQISRIDGVNARQNSEIAKRTTKDDVLGVFKEQDLATHAYVDKQAGVLLNEINTADSKHLKRLDLNEVIETRQNTQISALESHVDSIGSRLNHNRDIANGGTASAVSLAMLPAPADNTRQVSLMWGSYEGKSALAVGVAGTEDRISYKAGASYNGAEKTAVGAGLGFKF